MAATKKRQPAVLAMHPGFAAHMEADRKAHEWAVICLAYRRAGKFAHAKDAEDKAKEWLRTLLGLENNASSMHAGQGNREL